MDPHHPFDPPAPYSTMYDPDKLAPPVCQEGELDDKPPHFRRHRTGRGFSNEKYDYRRLSAHDWGEVKAAYYGMVSLVDYNVGRILDALRQKGILDDTLILFTSDHGELMGDHGLLFKGPFLYDCLIKAPMVVQWPGVVPKGARYAQLTEHVDIMPTILGLRGHPRSLRRAGHVHGSHPARRQRRRPRLCADRVQLLRLGPEHQDHHQPDYKLTYYAGERFGELYDRNADPDEFVNHWDDPDYADVKAELLKQLTDRIIETEDTLPIRIGKY